MTSLSAGSVRRGDEDWFEGSTGNDTIHGGLDGQNDDPNQNHWNEINYYERGISGIEVTFGSTSRAGTVLKLGDAGTDTFTSIDVVRGTAHADKFVGGIRECNVSSDMQVRTLFDGSQAQRDRLSGRCKGVGRTSG